jgi:hypothetical protein
MSNFFVKKSNLGEKHVKFIRPSGRPAILGLLDRGLYMAHLKQVVPCLGLASGLPCQPVRLSAAGYGFEYASARFPGPICELCHNAICYKAMVSPIGYSDLVKRAVIFNTRWGRAEDSHVELETAEGRGNLATTTVELGRWSAERAAGCIQHRSS